jgi:hypothetical protein
MSDFDPVAAFNAANPVGTLVNFWPGDRREDAWTARTRTPAWYMGRFPVVSVEGYAGGISLTHVQPVHEPADVSPDQTHHQEGRS